MAKEVSSGGGSRRVASSNANAESKAPAATSVKRTGQGRTMHITDSKGNTKHVYAGQTYSTAESAKNARSEDAAIRAEQAQQRSAWNPLFDEAPQTQQSRYSQEANRERTAEQKAKDEKRETAKSFLDEANRLEQEKASKSDVWENGIYVGMDKATSDEYDRKIAEARAKSDEALSEVNTTDKQRDDILAAYLKAVDDENAIAGFATDPMSQQAADAARVARERAEDALKEENRRLGNDVYFGLADEAQSRDLFEGWAGERAAGSAAALGTGLEWLGDKTNVDSFSDAGSTLFNAAQGWQGQAQEDWASGTEDMTERGKQIAGLGKTGADMTMDMIENFIVPGAGRVAMAARVAGGGALTQAGRERNDVDARMTKAVLDGGVAFLSEYLLGGAEQVYGKSVVGKGLEKMFGKASPILKTVLNTEGLEEGLEYALGYLGDKLLKLDPNGEFSGDELKQNMLVGYIMGVLFNGIAGGIEYGAPKLKAVVDEAYDAVSQNIPPQEAAQMARLEPDENVQIKSGTQVEESEPEIQRAEQAPEGEPSSTVTVPLTETAPMETSPNPMIAAIQERMTISPREASQIRNNPELRAAFEEAYRISLDGLGEKAAAKAITDAVKNQGVHERSVNQFGELPEAAPSFAPAETGPNKSERAFARGGKARDAITSILAGDDISRKDATRIMSDPVMWEAFQEATGIDLSKKGKTEQNVREAFREAKANQNQEAQTDLQTQLAEAEAELDNYLDGLQGTPGELKTPEYNDLVNRVNDLRSQLGMEPETAATETATETNANEAETEAVPAQEETAAKEETPSQNQSESNAKPAQNKPKKPDHSRKITNSNEDTDAAFDKLNEKNGSIEPGENPARDINVPKKDTKGLKVGEGARTIFEADATPDERIASLKAAVVNGNFGHIPVSNDTRSKNAVKKLAKEGWTKSVADFMAAVDSGKVDADTIALGAHLLNEAGNSKECSGKQYVELAMAYNDAVSGSGKALAAARILKTLTPEGKLYGMEKAVEKINKEIRKNNEKKKPGKQKAEVKLNEELVEDYLKAETDEQRDAIHDEIIKDAAAQVPNTFRDKFTALRYLNMLGNFKTQVRNVFGNVGMTAAQKVKNEVRSALEGIASTVTGGKYDRQYKARYGTERYAAAREDFLSDKDLQALAMGEKKFSDVAKQSEAEILDEKKPFSDKNPVGKFLNAYSKVTNAAMEFGDLVFVRGNYADALAGYMNAHGITAADWKAMVNDPAKAAEVEKARSFAIKQAQEATFRDTNAVSSFASSFDRNWGKGAKAVAQGVIPFRRTPANVLVRMEEYSPLGIANTVIKGIQSAKGTAEVSDVIDSAAKSMTGTGLTILGYILASRGQARTKDDDKNEEALAKLRGQQDYSIEIGGKSVTMDWLSPASSPFFMGVELFNLMNDEGLTWADGMAALTSFTNPMLEMSMLSGVNDALNNLSDFEGDNSAVLQFFLNSAWSYLTQGITNTMLGQVEQFSEKNRQTYYTDSDNPLLRPSAQKKLAKLGNKTPGVDYQSADYIDAWGRKQEADSNPVTRGLNTFLNPGYVSDLDKKATEADAAIEELYRFGKEQKEEDNFPNVVPRTPSRYTTVNGTKLTPEEYDEYATTKGQESLKAVSEFVNSEQFKSMDKFSQAQTISDIYSYSEFLAAKKIAESRGEEYYDERYSPLLTGQKEDGENTYKAPIKEADIPEYLGFMNAYNRAMNAKDYDEVDALIDSARSLPRSAMTGATQHATDMEALVDMKNAGLSDANIWYQFKDEMRDIYSSEKRTAAKASDYIRAIGSGKYSNKDADAIMGYERRRSEETVQHKKDQVQYNLDKAGMGGEYSKVWSMIESVDTGDMSKDSFNKYIDKNVPTQYRKAIKDACSDYVEDRHKAGKYVSGFYKAVRDSGYDADIAAQFYALIDANYNGSYTKKEIDAAVREGFGTGQTAKDIRRAIKEYTGK